MNVLKFSRHESKLLAWLLKAASTDDARPVLEDIHVNDNSIVATDGWRMHWVDKEGVSAFAEVSDKTMNLGKIRAGENLIEPEEHDDFNYPDCKSLIPTREPVFEVAINPKFLVDALQGLDTAVVLRFFGTTGPFEVMGKIASKDADDTNVYALIMPMDLELVKKDYNWNPKQEKETES